MLSFFPLERLYSYLQKGTTFWIVIVVIGLITAGYLVSILFNFTAEGGIFEAKRKKIINDSIKVGVSILLIVSVTIIKKIGDNEVDEEFAKIMNDLNEVKLNLTGDLEVVSEKEAKRGEITFASPEAEDLSRHSDPEANTYIKTRLLNEYGEQVTDVQYFETLLNCEAGNKELEITGKIFNSSRTSNKHVVAYLPFEEVFDISIKAPKEHTVCSGIHY